MSRARGDSVEFLGRKKTAACGNNAWAEVRAIELPMGHAMMTSKTKRAEHYLRVRAVGQTNGNQRLDYNSLQKKRIASLCP